MLAPNTQDRKVSCLHVLMQYFILLQQFIDIDLVRDDITISQSYLDLIFFLEMGGGDYGLYRRE